MRPLKEGSRTRCDLALVIPSCVGGVYQKKKKKLIFFKKKKSLLFLLLLASENFQGLYKNLIPRGNHPGVFSVRPGDLFQKKQKGFLLSAYGANFFFGIN